MAIFTKYPRNTSCTWLFREGRQKVRFAKSAIFNDNFVQNFAQIPDQTRPVSNCTWLVHAKCAKNRHIFGKNSWARPTLKASAEDGVCVWVRVCVYFVCVCVLRACVRVCVFTCVCERRCDIVIMISGTQKSRLHMLSTYIRPLYSLCALSTFAWNGKRNFLYIVNIIIMHNWCQRREKHTGTPVRPNISQ